MPSELVSRKTRTELREYFVGTSLSIISDEFSAANIALAAEYSPPTSGQRRTLVEQYYHTLDWTHWPDVRRFLTVYENVLMELEERRTTGEEWATKAFASLKRWIERDGFVYADGRLSRVGSRPALDQIAHAAGALDLPELNRQVRRLESAIDSDPGLAIGTAKELVETVCRTILDQRQIAIGDTADLVQLVKETRKALGLLPESITSSARGADTIRRLLSNLASVAQAVGELRNLYGTGHGKSGGSKGLAPRHARLAVGSAATLATFLLETHAEREATTSHSSAPLTR